MLTDYKFNTTDKPDRELSIDIMDETLFDIHSRGKRLRDKSLIKNHFNERSILASGFRTIFLSEKPNEICGKVKLLLQEKRAGKNSNIVNKKIVAINDKIVEKNTNVLL